MLFVTLLMTAIAIWFYVAAIYQFQGYVWVDKTCANLTSFCQSPNKVAIGCIAVFVFFLIARTFKE
jgi:fumarate reductase subunit C